MFITLPLALIGVGYLVYLLFGAATYALPLLAALGTGFAAAHAGASGTAALLLAAAVFMAVIAAGRMATALLPSRHARAAVMFAFAVPAAIIGFEIASALVHFSDIGTGGIVVAAIAGLVTAAVAARRHTTPSA